MAQFIFGIDIGGTSAKCGLFENETLVEKWSVPTSKENNGAAVLPDIAKSILDVMDKKGISKEDVLGVGIDVPGPVEGGVVQMAVNLGWGVKNVVAEMEELTGGLKTVALNDANAAALGEMVAGGGKGSKNLVMVTLGTGIGGGVVLGGRVIEGVHGAAGELGHMHVNDDEEEACGCGNKGCWEQYGSATGMVRCAKRALAKFEGETVLRDKQFDARMICEAASAGDAFAMQCVEDYALILGKGMAQIAAVIDPEVFVLGGGVAGAGELIMKPIRKYYDMYAFHACRGARLEVATLGNDAGIYGSMAAVKNMD